MSLKDCIDVAVSNGEMTLEDGQSLKRQYDRLVEKFGRVRAGQDLAAMLEEQAAEKKRRAAMVEATRQTLSMEVLSHRDSWGRLNPGAAMPLLIENLGEAKFQSVQFIHQGLLKYFHSQLNKLSWEARGKAKFTGDVARRFGRTAALMDNIVLEAFGTKTGDAQAAAFAKQVQAVFEELRLMFNEYGGDIKKLEGYGLPQHHNAEKMLAATREKWVEYMMKDGVLDWDRMDPRGRFADPAERKATLEYIFEQIATDGWATREPSGQAFGKGAIFSRHQDHRFLHFKDGEQWLAYQKAFGDDDVFASIVGHISTMTRDIALMRKFGPNPASMREYLKQMLKARASNLKANSVIREEQIRQVNALIRGDSTELDTLRAEQTALMKKIDKALSWMRRADANQASARYKRRRAEYDTLSQQLLDVTQRMIAEEERLRTFTPLDHQQAQDLLASIREEMPDAVLAKNVQNYYDGWIYKADGLYNLFVGTGNRPVNLAFANISQSVRNYITSTSLGAATLSAMSDVSMQASARMMAGMPQKAIVDGYAKILAPGGQQYAMTKGLILDTALHTMHQVARMDGTTRLSGATGYMADRVLAASGMPAFTQAGKHVAGMDFMHFIADIRAQGWKDLNAQTRNFFEYSGFDEAKWNRLRAAEPDETGLVSLDQVRQLDRDLAIDYMGLISRFTQIAVPEPTLAARQLMFQNTRPGTIAGEFLRFAMQFKSFSVTVVVLHMTPIYRQMLAGNYKEAAAHASALFALMTLFGALSLQSKEISKGRDAKPTDTVEFWMAAMAQGGGLGIWGDFLFADTNRFGGGPTSTLLGPAAGRFDNLFNLTAGNIKDLRTDKDTNFGRELTRFIGQNTPGLSSLWYARAAYEHMFLDRLQEFIDPKVGEHRRRLINTTRRKHKQEFWWAPGDRAPSRAPNVIEPAIRGPARLMGQQTSDAGPAAGGLPTSLAALGAPPAMAAPTAVAEAPAPAAPQPAPVQVAEAAPTVANEPQATPKRARRGRGGEAARIPVA